MLKVSYKWRKSSHHNPILWNCVRLNHDVLGSTTISKNIRYVVVEIQTPDFSSIHPKKVNFQPNY